MYVLACCAEVTIIPELLLVSVGTAAEPGQDIFEMVLLATSTLVEVLKAPNLMPVAPPVVLVLAILVILFPVITLFVLTLLIKIPETAKEPDKLPTTPETLLLVICTPICPWLHTLA